VDLTILHGRKASQRERISTLELFFDQQFLFGQEPQRRRVPLKVGTREAQHSALSH
jgi:hypothetical protein